MWFIIWYLGVFYIWAMMRISKALLSCKMLFWPVILYVNIYCCIYNKRWMCSLKYFICNVCLFYNVNSVNKDELCVQVNVVSGKWFFSHLYEKQDYFFNTHTFCFKNDFIVLVLCFVKSTVNHDLMSKHRFLRKDAELSCIKNVCFLIVQL